MNPFFCSLLSPLVQLTIHVYCYLNSYSDTCNWHLHLTPATFTFHSVNMLVMYRTEYVVYITCAGCSCWCLTNKPNFLSAGRVNNAHAQYIFSFSFLKYWHCCHFVLLWFSIFRFLHAFLLLERSHARQIIDYHPHHYPFHNSSSSCSSWPSVRLSLLHVIVYVN